MAVKKRKTKAVKKKTTPRAKTGRTTVSRKKTSAYKAMLDDFARSGLTEHDAKKLGVQVIPSKGFRPARYRQHYFEQNGKPNCMWRDRSLATNAGRRYDQPSGMESRIFYSPLLSTRRYKKGWAQVAKDTSVRIVITEGEKKGSKACKAGIVTIAIGGVWNFLSDHKLIKDFYDIDWKERTAEICFDSEPSGVGNHMVSMAIDRISRELLRLGAVVNIVYLPAVPDEKIGLDDYLLTHTATDFDALLRHEPKPIEKETDYGNARRLVRLYGQDIKYVTDLGWFCWDGSRWKRNDAAVMQMAKETVLSIYDEAAMEKQEERKTALSKWAVSSQSRQRLEAMVALAQTEKEIILNVNELDKDPWLLNVRNGTLDLRTCELLPPQREHFITMQANVDFNPSAKAPVFKRVLLGINLKNNRPIIGFLQRYCGYTLTGNTMAKALVFLYGPGGDNGKSTLIELLKDLLGDYAHKTRAETFMIAKQANSGPSPELIALRGKRLIWASELDDSQKFNAAFIKDLTGGVDTITGRDLHKGVINFVPTFKLWFYGNYRPVFKGDDAAAWRRMNLIPFEVSIPKEKQDDTLPEKLLAEGEGILNWALEGLAAYLENGLQPPKEVLDATEEYREENDRVGRFIDECCVTTSPDNKELFSDLYNAFTKWCMNEEGTNQIIAKQKFGQQLEARGYKTKRGKGNVKMRTGIKLKQPNKKKHEK